MRFLRPVPAVAVVTLLLASGCTEPRSPAAPEPLPTAFPEETEGVAIPEAKPNGYRLSCPPGGQEDEAGHCSLTWRGGTSNRSLPIAGAASPSRPGAGAVIVVERGPDGADPLPRLRSHVLATNDGGLSWQRHAVPSPGMGVSTSTSLWGLAYAENGTLHVIGVSEESPIQYAAPGPATLFMASSHDDGRTWSEPKAIERPGQAVLASIAVAGESIGVFWLDLQARYAISEDGGASFPHRGTIQNCRAPSSAVAVDGRLAIACFPDRGNGTVRLLAWNGTDLARVGKLLPEYDDTYSGPMTLSAVAGGRLALLYNGFWSDSPFVVAYSMDGGLDWQTFSPFEESELAAQDGWTDLQRIESADWDPWGRLHVNMLVYRDGIDLLVTSMDDYAVLHQVWDPTMRAVLDEAIVFQESVADEDRVVTYDYVSQLPEGGASLFWGPAAATVGGSASGVHITGIEPVFGDGEVK